MLGKIRSEFKCLEGHCFNVSTCNRNDIIVVMVDLNAKVGNNNILMVRRLWRNLA